MPIHIVKQGEHISGITSDAGFSDFNIIWNHPKNAELKKLRDPHVLFPGDQIFVPDKILKLETGVTAKIHTFQVNEVPLFLRLRIRDLSENPVTSSPYKLKLDMEDPARAGTTDGKGILLEKISPKVKEAKLDLQFTLPPAKKTAPPEIEELHFDIKVGNLNPKTTLSGQQARLNNLGYFAGFAIEDTEQLRWAIEEFQCDHMGMKPVKVVPVITPESEDPMEKTGVQDQKTIDALEAEHGI